MNSRDDAKYRLELAKNHLKQAEKTFNLRMWQTSYLDSQLCCENSAKAIIAMFKPVAHTHKPANELKRLIRNDSISEKIRNEIGRNINNFKKMGLQEHILATYGDEKMRKTPWDLIKKKEAKDAIEIARKCYSLAKDIFATQYMGEEG